MSQTLFDTYRGVPMLTQIIRKFDKRVLRARRDLAVNR